MPYSLPKLDLVAIPNFAAGAMENWGLLMYRETDLLVDDSVDDINQRYDIATTVAHETVSLESQLGLKASNSVDAIWSSW